MENAWSAWTALLGEAGWGAGWLEAVELGWKPGSTSYQKYEPRQVV